jgi:hypothetical protein
MDAISLLLIAIGSLLMLDIAAASLAGDARARRDIRRPR